MCLFDYEKHIPITSHYLLGTLLHPQYSTGLCVASFPMGHRLFKFDTWEPFTIKFYDTWNGVSTNLKSMLSIHSSQKLFKVVFRTGCYENVKM